MIPNFLTAQVFHRHHISPSSSVGPSMLPANSISENGTSNNMEIISFNSTFNITDATNNTIPSTQPSISIAPVLHLAPILVATQQITQHRSIPIRQWKTSPWPNMTMQMNHSLEMPPRHHFQVFLSMTFHLSLHVSIC
mmetsp:Transcript_23462/g.33637  ORF Transcript_23462/g.33637 Transcript_23462/m.33637 type:complete len:138 (-) Transcript_23462:252-665(-)